MTALYRFQVVRYAPNRVSEEFYNIAVLLYGPDGVLLDARFAPDFARLRCHPLADLDFLARLRDDFENRRLAGEGFSGYVEDLKKNLSASLQVSDEKVCLAEDPAAEMERLERTYLLTPRRSEIDAAGPAPGTRRWVLARMRDTFQLYHLTERLESNVPVGSYVSPRFAFHLDYAYRPEGETRFLHALSQRNDVNDAGRLCFVFDRVRTQTAASLTVVAADGLPDDTRALLGSSHIRPWPVSRLDELAIAIRGDLGLH